MQKNACWVFETVRIISIIIRLICFTEKVYGSSPYSPNIKKNLRKKNRSKKNLLETRHIQQEPNETKGFDENKGVFSKELWLT